MTEVRQEFWEERKGELYRLLVENAKDYAIFVLDLDGRVQSWNPGAEQLIGYSADEIIGKPSEIFFTAEDVEQGIPQRELQQALEEGRGDDDRWHLRKDGSRFWAGGIMVPLRDETGGVRGFAKIMRDRTEWKIGKEREQFQAKLLDVVGQAVIATAPDGTILYWNRFAETLYGWSEADVTGRNFIDVVVPEGGVASAQEIMDRLRAGQRWSGEFLVRRRDGTTFPAQVTKTPVFDDQGVLRNIVGVSSDLSDRKRIEDELREAHRRKDEFLAMLAHELRNPLAPIRSGLELLALEEGVRNETVELMQQQVSHLVRLVDDLLDVSRITQGRIELRREQTELLPLINRSVDAIRPSIESRCQEFTVRTPSAATWLNADPVRLVQVIENLLANASKYSDKGGRIELLVEIRDGKAVISVQDDGIGIEPNLLGKVFDLFTQSTHSLDRSQGGLGLGLTLVKKLVEMHGGSVSAYSEGLGKGSRFDVHLPIVPHIERQDSQHARPAASKSKSCRILLVDDNASAATMLSQLITRLGPHEVETANDGPSALDRAQHVLPDIVILDIGLPGMDGLAVARKLRENKRYENTLLVALTGYGQEEDHQNSKAAGFDVHLVKPVEVETLSQMLSHPKLSSNAPAG